jgi:hypothetical protein
MSQNPDTLFAGTMTCTNTAAVITGMPGGIRDVLIQIDPDSAASVYVGNATVQSIKLDAGEKFSWPLSSANAIYVKTASGEGIIRWLARQ